MGNKDRNRSEAEDASCFRQLVERLPGGLAIIDAHSVITLVNERFARMLGYEQAELIGINCIRLVCDDRRAATDQVREQRLRGDSGSGEAFLRHKDGHDVPVAFESLPLMGDSGVLGESAAYTGTLAIVTDLTERKKTESILREQNALYASMLDALNEAGEGVVINDGARYVWANEAFARIFGYTVDELLALPSHIPLIPPEEQATQIPRMRARLADGGSDHGEVTMLHRSGRRLQIEYGTTPLSFGDPSRRLSVLRDVTDRKEMQARMILGERMASLGTLAAGVAHEINNPLAYVLANLDLIAEEMRAMVRDSPSGRMREMEIMVNEARQGAERVRKIVRGLRTLSRADEERKTLLDVRSVLDLSINMAFTEIKHRARLVKDYKEVSPVEADETRLTQVFINLLVNAAQAIPEGHADRNEIRLVTRMAPSGISEEPAPASRVLVQVRDTGRGIPAQVISRIFDPFFTTKGIGEGTGLGLSICHSIVTALGGEIQVESDEGKGSAFSVRLRPAPLDVADRPREPRRISSPPLAKRAHVLIIEDEVMIATALRRVLEKEHEVTSVVDGKQALDMLQAGRTFDIILCDLMMPIMTGMDFYAEMARTMPEIVERIVFLTGGAFTPAAQAFLDSVPNPRFEKPVSPQNLRALVRSFVR